MQRSPKLGSVSCPTGNSDHLWWGKSRVDINGDIDLKIKANASEDVEEVSFSLNGKYLGKDMNSPFTINFSPNEADVAVGTYTLNATATDENFNKGYASINIVVTAGDLGNN